MTHRAPQRIRLGWRRRDCVALAALLACWGARLLWAAAGGGGTSDQPSAIYPDRVGSVRERIDPNTATVASLRRLRLVGPEKAKAIVEYRESRPAGERAFEFLEDLQNVPGIGPGIADRARGLVALPSREQGQRGAARPAGTTQP